MIGSQRFAVVLHVLTVLAWSKRKMSSEELSKSIQTHPPLLRQALAPILEKGGLIEAYKGKAGGYVWTGQASRLKLWDLYTLVNTPQFFPAHHYKPNKKCPISCGIARVMVELEDDAQKALKSSLSSKTLQDVLDEFGGEATCDSARKN